MSSLFVGEVSTRRPHLVAIQAYDCRDVDGTRSTFGPTVEAEVPVVLVLCTTNNFERQQRLLLEFHQLLYLLLVLLQQLQ